MDSLSINTGSSDLGEILIEDSATTLETVGAIYFSDTSADGFHIPTFAQASGPELGVFTVNILDDATGPGDQTGQVDWTYAVDNAAVQYLAAGQSVDLVYRVTIIDSDGTGPDQYVDVTITLTGTNDAPLFTSTQSTPAPLGEDALTPITGTLTFDDIDTLDTHSISAVALAKTGDIAGLTATDDALKALLTTVANSTTTATNGSIDWTFTNSAAPFQYLQVGETLTLAYTLTLSDGHGGTDTRTLTFTVSGSNDGPVAAADTDGVTEAGGVANAIAGIPSTSGNVLTNDSDADYNDEITVTAIADGTLGVALTGTYGALTLNADGSYSYALDDGLAATQALNGTPGTDVFSYTITDEHGETSTASLTITITGANDAPVALNDVDAVTEAGGVANATAGTPSASGNVLTNDSDVDAGDSKSVSAISGGTVGAALAGTYGTLTLNADGSYSYDLDDALAATQALNGTPGTETFTYTVSDAAGATATATLTVTVTGANDTLVLVADTASVIESGTDALGAVAGTPSASGNVLDNDTDVDAADGKSVSTVSFGMTSVAAGQPIVGTYGFLILGANGAYSYTLNNNLTATQALAAGQVVTEIFTYAATDTAGLGGTQTLTITVTGTNDAPVAFSDTGLPLIEAGYAMPGLGSSVGNVLTNDSDIDTGDTQTVVGVAAGAQSSASGSVASAVQGTYGTLTIGSDGAYSYALDNMLAATQALTQGQNVTETFTYTMQDGSGVASSATVSFGITGTNDAPIVVSPTTNSVTEAGFVGAGTSSVTGAAGAANWTDVDSSEAGDLHITAVGFGSSAISAFSESGATPTPSTGDFQVNSDVSGSQTAGTVTALTGGRYVVAWINNSGYAVGKIFEADGTAASGELALGQQSGSSLVSLAAGADGGFIMAYSHSGHFHFNTFSSSGASTSGDFLISAPASMSGATIAAASTGSGFAISYVTSTDVYLEIYPSAGTDRQVLEINAADPESKFYPTVIAVGAQYLITWSESEANGIGIYGQLYSAAGSAASAAFRVDGGTVSYNAQQSSASALTGGGFVISYMSYDGSGSNWNIHAQRFDSSGNKTGTEILVNSYTTSAQSTPSVTSLAEGGFLITWVSFGQDGDGSGIFGQRFDADGAAIGSEFQINAYTTGSQSYAQGYNGGSIGAVQLTNGQIVAIWDGESATDSSGISGRLFTLSQSDPNALPGEMAIAGTYGTLYLEADGDYRYVLDNTKAATQALAAGEQPTETFTYTTSNRSGGAGNEATGQIVITVDGANDAPVAVANVGTPLVEAGYGVAGIAGSTGNVLANDTDIDTGDTKAVTGVAAGTPSSASGSVGSAVQGTYGSITIAADGSYTYTLDDMLAATKALTQGQAVTETFTYTMQDSAGVAATTTVTFGVTGTNDAPVVTGPNTSIVIEAGAAAAGTPSVAASAGGANWTDDDAGEAATLHITAAGFGGTATDAFTIGSTTPAPVAGQFQISAPAPDSQGSSSVAALTDGGFVVTWSSYDVGGLFWEVFGQRYDATGAASGGAFHVNTTTAADQVFSTTTALSGGGFVVTWRSDVDGSDSGIFAQRYDASGAKAGGEFLVNTIITGPQTFSSTAALAGGGFVVTWASSDGVSNDGSGLGIHGQRFDASGAKVGDEFTVNTTVFNTQYYSSTAAVSNGGFVVTWTSSGTDGSGEGVYGQRYDATGARAGTEFLVNATTAGHQEYSSTTGLPGGGFVVTWQSSAGDGSGYGVYGQRYDANGVTVGAQFLVNSTTANDQSAPQTVALSDGGFVVSWTSFGEDGSATGVYAQRYDANGAASGSAFQLNDYTTGDQYQGFPNGSSAIAQLADGRLVAVWDGDSATETGGVSGRIFTVPGEMEIEGTYGTLYLKANGDYRYVLDNSKAATQALDVGDSPTETFTYTTSNRSGGAGNEATGQIVVTVTGANDAPVIGTVTQPVAVSEIANAAAQDIAAITGTISVSDVDGGDTLATVVGTPTIAVTHGGDAVTGLTIPAALTDALAFTATIDNAASASGAARSVTWTYNPDAADLDFLAAGDALTITYPVSVTDGTTPSEIRYVTITINGSNDGPVAADDSNATDAVTEAGGVGNAVTGDASAAGNVITGSDTDADHDAVLTVQSASGVDAMAPVTSATVIQGAYGTLTISADGAYSYALDNGSSATQALNAGDAASDVFTYIVADDHGALDSATLTIAITGSNDAPVIGVASVIGGVVEAGTDVIDDNAEVSGDASGTLGDNWSDVDDGEDATLAVVSGSAGADDQAALAFDGMTDEAAILGVYGTLYIQADGGYRYVLDDSAGGAADRLAHGVSVTDVFNYSITDDSSDPLTASSTITVVIAGRNDAPIITVETGDSAAATLVETDAGLTASGTLTVSDVDAGDEQGYTFTAAVTGGVDNGFDNAALLAMFTAPAGVAQNALPPTGISTLTWAFDSLNTSFDYLAPTESLEITYTLTADDGHGGTDTQDVVITITGTNDAPVITSAAPERAITEGDASVQTVVGVIDFTDLDLSQHGDHSVSTTVAISGTGPSSDWPTNAAALDLFGTLVLGVANGDPVADAYGKLGYGFQASDTLFDFLAAGETLVFDYTVTINDGTATASQVVQITVTGTNDAPVIAGGPATAAFTEVADTTPGTGDFTQSGAFTFTDLDVTEDDTHVVSATLGSVGGDGPTDGRPLTATIESYLTVGLDQTATDDQHGKATWSFTAPAADFDYLGAGETLILTYVVHVDDSATSDNETVTVTITGANDQPVVSIETGDSATGAITETDNGNLNDSGTLTVTDIDLTDAVTVTAINATIASGNAYGLDIASMLTATTGNLTDPATGVGQIVWTFHSDNETFDHLAEGETLVIDYELVIADGEGGSTSQVVTVTITGTNDAPMISAGLGVPTSGTVAETNAGGLTTGGELDVSDTDLTDIVTAAVTDVDVLDGSANGIDLAVLQAMLSVTSGDLTDADGSGVLTWTFDSGATTFDYLGDTESLELAFEITVTDDEGATGTKVVTVMIEGTNDAPTVSAGGTATGAVDEAASGATTIGSTGSFTITDLDLTDMLGTAEGGTTVAWSGGGTIPPAVVSALTDAGAFSFTSTATGAGNGLTIGWTWNAAPDLDFLAAGESLTITTPVTVSDNHGGSVTQDVVITVTGTNDAPVITNGTVTGSLGEPANTTGQPGTILSAAGGSFSIADADTNGQTVLSTAFDTGAGHANGFTSNFAQRTLTDDQKTALLNGLSLTSITGNDGTVNWGYSIANDKIDFLRQGESLTLYFAVTANDGSAASNATASTVIAITITGTNDPIQQGVADITGAVSEPATGNATDTGTIPFTDADFSNHAVQVTALTSGLTGGTGTLTASVTDPAVTDGIGEVTWNYTVSSAVTDYLAQGQQVTETFRVRIIDSSGEILDNVVTVTVTGTNDRPVITSTAQSGTVIEDGTLTATGTVTATDVDTGATKTFSGDTTGDYGSFAVDAATGVWTYTLANASQQALAEGESHVETFTVTVTDEFNGTATQDVTITVTGTNDAPVITSGPQTGTVQEDVTLTATGTVTVTDVDNGATRSFAGNLVGAYGGFVIDGSTGVWTYMLANTAHQALAEGESHVETFTVTVTDDKGATATQDVVITVTGTNDLPVITSGTQAGAVVEDATLSASGQVIASDVDNGATRVFTGDETTDYGSFVVNATNGAWTYTLANGSAEVQSLAEGETVTETFTVTVTDDKGGFATQSVTITVTGANDGPVISSGPQSGAVAEDGILIRTGQVTAFDADADAVLAFTGDETTAHGSFVVNEATGAWTYTLDNVAAQALTQGQIVTETFTVTVTDDEGATTTQDVIVTVTGANDRPVITSDPQTGAVAEDATLIATGQVTATDADTGAVLTYTGGQAFIPTRFLPAPGHGDGTTDYGSFVVDATTGAWTYTLDNVAAQSLTQGQTVTETFTVIVTDDRGATATQNVVVTVTGTNDVPTIAANSTAGGIVEAAAGVVGTATVTGDLSLAGANWSDVDNGEDAALAVSKGASGSDAQSGLVFDGTAPGAQVGEAKIAGVYGDLFLLANGGFRYVLNDADSDTNGLDGDETATETFHYTIANNGGGAGSEATSTLTVDIQGSNDAATITVTNPAPVLESDTIATVSFLIADQVAISDADASDVAQDYIANSGSISAAGATPASGVLTDLVSFDAATGAISYDRAAFNWLDSDESVTYSVNFMAQSGDDGEVAQTLTFIINGQNDVPVAVADTATLAENVGGTFDLVANDTDADLHESQTLQSFSLGTVTGLGTLNGGQLADIADDFAIVGNQLVFSPSAGLPGTTEAIYDRLAPGQTATIVINYTIHDDSGATAAATFTLTITGAAETFNGTADGETIIGSNRADAMYGNGGDDTLTGNAGDDALYGGEGDDTLVGGSGNDALHADGGNDTLVGGNDTDTAYLNGNWADYTISGSGGTYTLIRDGQTVTASTIELFSFNGGAAVAAATILNDAPTLTGGSGTFDENVSDSFVLVTVVGSDLDLATAGLGESLRYAITAGDPNGVFEIDASGAISVASGKVLDYEAGGATRALTVTVTDAHGATATAGVTITVNDLNDEAPVFTSGASASVAENGAASALVYTAHANDADSTAHFGPVSYALSGADAAAFTLDGTTGELRLNASADHETKASYAVVITAAQGSGPSTMQAVTVTVLDVNEAPTNLALTGQLVTENAAINTVVGTLSASDVENEALTYSLLDSAGGRFAIVGNQIVTGSVLTDYEQAASHVVQVRVTDSRGGFVDQSFTITVGDVSPENVVGTDSADTMIGGADNDIFQGLGGNDIIDGGAGADVMTGGLGDDIYYVDNVFDNVVEANNEGTDTIYSSVNYSLGGRFAEALILTGTGNLQALGNARDNVLTGNSGNNLLNGQAGADIMTGGLGDDTYIVDTGADSVIELLNGGNDEVQTSLATYTLATNVEKLLGTRAIGQTLNGNAIANSITGGVGNDIIDGGGAADVMTGGLGNDTYYVNHIGDNVVELDGQGNDSIYSSVNYSLGGRFAETLTLTGTGDIQALGNASANRLVGNSGANILNGFQGSDTLTGGAGQDQFRFTTTLGTGNIDTITDFVAIDDTIALSKAVFAALGPLGTLGTDAFVVGTAAADASDRIIYNSTNGNLLYDADGTGSGGATLFAHIGAGLTLTHDDFLIIA